MLRILRAIYGGKTHWSLEDLAADPTLLRAIHEAHRLGLIEGLIVGPVAKGRYTGRLPMDVAVSGLTPAGRAALGDQTAG